MIIIYIRSTTTDDASGVVGYVSPIEREKRFHQQQREERFAKASMRAMAVDPRARQLTASDLTALRLGGTGRHDLKRRVRRAQLERDRTKHELRLQHTETSPSSSPASSSSPSSSSSSPPRSSPPRNAPLSSALYDAAQGDVDLALQTVTWLEQGLSAPAASPAALRGLSEGEEEAAAVSMRPARTSEYCSHSII